MGGVEGEGRWRERLRMRMVWVVKLWLKVLGCAGERSGADCKVEVAEWLRRQT